MLMPLVPRRNAAALAALAGALLAPGAAAAQGSLSGQGFGYPTGQLSARALGAGGAQAEFDAQSAVNPQGVGGWGGAGLFVQYEPEFRSVSGPGGQDRTTTSRFPLIAGALPVRERFAVGISVSTLLDRTFETRATRADTIGVDPVAVPVVVSERDRSEGAINDIRFAASFAPSPKLRAGLGLHAFTGENRRTLLNSFAPAEGAADTAEIGSVQQQRVLSYTGNAISAGFEWRPGRALALAASGRVGNDLTTRVGDTTVSKARIPSRVGAGLRFDGISGASIAARVDWQGWSAMSGLAEGVPVRDALEVGVGADVVGPRLGTNAVTIRAGARRRDLPFGGRRVNGAGGTETFDVREVAFSGGLGFLLAANRATLDVGVQRAARTASGADDLDESAWTMSVGLRVRP